MPSREVAFMWFRRRRRQPPPLLLPSLDRLAELIERVITLLELVDGHVLFAPGRDGYRLLERDGPPPAAGVDVELDDEWFSVLRLGPSPLPGRSAPLRFPRRKERKRPDRTFDR